VPGQRACYACACGAVGCRATNGLIQEATHAAELVHEITVRPIADYRTGRVRARILDDEDFWQSQTEI